MKQIQTNFQRVETKYILDRAILARLEAEMHAYLIPDDYATSTISNVYFDNDDFQMIQDSIARRGGREKLRMRTYAAEPTKDSQVFLEIKVPGEYPQWMSEILNKYGLEDQSFSKYGKAYLKSNELVPQAVKV